MNDQNHPNDELLPNQRYCPKCARILTHVNVGQCDYAKRKERQCKPCYHSRTSANTKSYNLKKLLNDDLNTFYWIGFLLADGWFSSDKQRFSLEIGEMDLDHLMSFVDYISYKNKIKERNHRGKHGKSKSFRMKVCNNTVVPLIIDKFKISPQKSYNPIDFNYYYDNFTTDQILSLVVGFIDGDGSIILHKTKSNRIMLQIGIHINWINFLNFIKSYLSAECTIITNKKMAILRLGNHEELKALKTKILKLNTPLLYRKWDRIKLDDVKGRERSKDRRLQALCLYADGKTESEIAEIVGVHKRTIQYYLNRYGSTK